MVQSGVEEVRGDPLGLGASLHSVAGSAAVHVPEACAENGEGRCKRRRGGDLGSSFGSCGLVRESFLEPHV